ncbi:hypothetical protein [Hymenobacter cheonanensis]|uniref:hypothetical protein n=1 Tax=Hymenobacter sp. CA2-7 TaxID=3063993 RepID=UPI002712AE36|nr:hypothetical protein [Hymenobacter sp. CA2-7]MDO7886732.1 hypothetical protein [Hymenobacter sp. CA2-7]
MIANTKNWLAAYYKISEEKIESYFKDEDVPGFLIIWTIFEQKLFGGFVKVGNIKNHSVKELDKILFALETEFIFFFEAYQDKARFKNLRHDQKAEEISLLLSVDKNKLSAENKLYILLFVVYRYRNNIFHGNKPVPSWSRYRKEIGYCVNIMKCLLEA